GGTSCLWYITDAMTSAKSCSYRNGKLTLVTSSDSAVALTFNGRDLSGTFTLQNGQRFTITMRRKAVVPPASGGWANGLWRGTVQGLTFGGTSLRTLRIGAFADGPVCEWGVGNSANEHTKGC